MAQPTILEDKDSLEFSDSLNCNKAAEVLSHALSSLSDDFDDLEEVGSVKDERASSKTLENGHVDDLGHPVAYSEEPPQPVEPPAIAKNGLPSSDSDEGVQKALDLTAEEAAGPNDIIIQTRSQSSTGSSGAAGDHQQVPPVPEITKTENATVKSSDDTLLDQTAVKKTLPTVQHRSSSISDGAALPSQQAVSPDSVTPKDVSLDKPQGTSEGIVLQLTPCKQGVSVQLSVCGDKVGQDSASTRVQESQPKSTAGQEPLAVVLSVVGESVQMRLDVAEELPQPKSFIKAFAAKDCDGSTGSGSPRGPATPTNEPTSPNLAGKPPGADATKGAAATALSPAAPTFCPESPVVRGRRSQPIATPSSRNPSALSIEFDDFASSLKSVVSGDGSPIPEASDLKTDASGEGKVSTSADSVPSDAKKDAAASLAPASLPKLNVNAPVFVPSFAVATPVPSPAPAAPRSRKGKNHNKDAHSSGGSSGGEPRSNGRHQARTLPLTPSGAHNKRGGANAGGGADSYAYSGAANGNGQYQNGYYPQPAYYGGYGAENGAADGAAYGGVVRVGTAEEGFEFYTQNQTEQLEEFWASNPAAATKGKQRVVVAGGGQQNGHAQGNGSAATTNGAARKGGADGGGAGGKAWNAVQPGGEEESAAVAVLAEQYGMYTLDSLQAMLKDCEYDLAATLDMLGQLEAEREAARVRAERLRPTPPPLNDASSFPSLSDSAARAGTSKKGSKAAAAASPAAAQANGSAEEAPAAPAAVPNEHAPTAAASQNPMGGFAAAVKKAGGSSTGNVNAAPAASPTPAAANGQQPAEKAGGKKGGVPWVSTGEPVAAQYAEAREQARDLARLRNQCFQQATQAYLSGDRALAKELGQKGRECNEQMKQLHEQAADRIFKQRNTRVTGVGKDGPIMIDLHGLHAKEAVAMLRREFTRLRSASRSGGGSSVAAAGAGKAAAPRRSGTKVQVLVGTGHHTKGARTPARLPPAVEAFLQSEQLPYGRAQPGMLEVTL